MELIDFALTFDKGDGKERIIYLRFLKILVHIHHQFFLNWVHLGDQESDQWSQIRAA